jgi:hypothetical protein
MPNRRQPATTAAPAGSVVHLVPPEPADADYDQLADTLLVIADEMVAAEDRIKRAALAAAESGDAAAAASILRRWLEEPPTALAASL